MGRRDRNIGHLCVIRFCIGPVGKPSAIDAQETRVREIVENALRTVDFNMVTGVVWGISRMQLNGQCDG